MSDSGAYYLNLWRKSIYFELVNRQTGALEEGFAFSLPPQSIEITESQRVAETKTYGGLFIDDYGMDSAKITISGFTGNSQVRQIYTKKSTAWMNGKNELFTLRDRMMRYKSRIQKYADLEMRMYDFTSLPDDLSINKNVRIAHSDGWVVNLRDFRVSRSKDQPFFYRYTIELTGIYPIGTYRVKESPAIRPEAEVRKRITGLRNALNAVAGWYNDGTSAMARIAARLNDLSNAIDKFEARFNAFLSVTTSAITGVIDASTGVLDSLFSTYDTIAGLATFPADFANAVLDSAIALRVAIEDFADTHGDILPDSVIAQLDSGVYESVADRWEILTETQAGVRDAIQEASELIEYSQSPLVSTAIVTRASNGDTQIRVTHGTVSTTATSETQLADLATQFCGNPDEAILIASYNGLTGDDDIAVGDIIQIPLTEEPARVTANLIYAPQGQRDSFGVDMRLDSAGNIVISEAGEMALVTGAANMEQAITLRLAESIGRRIRLSSYGIRNEIGSAMNLSLAYLISSIKDTVLQDPRVTDVTNMGLQGDGDTIVVIFDYTTLGGETAQFTGNF